MSEPTFCDASVSSCICRQRDPRACAVSCRSLVAAETYLTVESMLPVMICGSASWHTTEAIVLVCPVSVKICALVRMSQTCSVSDS